MWEKVLGSAGCDGELKYDELQLRRVSLLDLHAIPLHKMNVSSIILMRNVEFL